MEEAWEIVNDSFLDAGRHRWSPETWQVWMFLALIEFRFGKLNSLWKGKSFFLCLSFEFSIPKVRFFER